MAGEEETVTDTVSKADASQDTTENTGEADAVSEWLGSISLVE